MFQETRSDDTRHEESTGFQNLRLVDPLPETEPMAHEKTLKTAVTVKGIGVHSGKTMTMVLTPAEEGAGISFVRTDITNRNPVIPARWDAIVDSRLCTRLGNAEGVTIGTVEHLMAALFALEIDNLRIEIDGPEVPILDGSAAPFIDLLENQTRVQSSRRRMIQVLKPITIEDGKRWATLMPDFDFSIQMEIDFAGRSAMAPQSYTFSGTPEKFRSEISRARTYGFFQDVEKMRAAGLALGGSLDNAVVIQGDTVLNPEGFRFKDECVRHKVLDAVGDLYLAGGVLLAHYQGFGSGHEFNARILKALFSDPDAWCDVE